MKLKLVTCALFMLMVFPSVASHVESIVEDNEVSFVPSRREERPKTRSPFDFDISVQSISNTLYVMFTGDLSDANITISDSEGNVVVQQTSVTLSVGTTFSITPDDSYPYNVAITSPTLDLIGQIINE